MFTSLPLPGERGVELGGRDLGSRQTGGLFPGRAGSQQPVAFRSGTGKDGRFPPPPRGRSSHGFSARRVLRIWKQAQSEDGFPGCGGGEGGEGAPRQTAATQDRGLSLARINSGPRDRYTVVETQRFVRACRNDGPPPLRVRETACRNARASDGLYWYQASVEGV